MAGTAASCLSTVAATWLCAGRGPRDVVGVARSPDSSEEAGNLDFVENPPTLRCRQLVLKPSASQIKYSVWALSHKLMASVAQ